MGGNLFKLGRISQSEYLKIEQTICQYLDGKLGNCYRIPRYYQTKADFGDLDIVVSNAVTKDIDWQELRQEIVNDLQITQYKSDGRVFSTVYQNFQVDYFLVPEQFFISTYNYLSFNDLGNLIGKICRKFNLKYGELGLAYVYRRQTSNFKKDLLITTDFKAICDFLNLDYCQWQLGFTTLEAMFDWIIDCPYFSIQPYLETANTLKKRIKERKTLQYFLDYLEQKQITKTYAYNRDRDFYIPLIDRYFPEANLLERIELERQQEAIVEMITAKFSGKLVRELIPELEGKALGYFIVNFKAQFADFESFILNKSEAEIQTAILNYYRYQSLNDC